MGEVCSKMVIGERHEFLLSFCETGSKVHIYMTTLIPFKPVTLGPFESAAKAINHVKIIDNILMIVDNDDDPFRRAGGVYLYYINTDSFYTGEILEFLDYLDYEDLQIQGFAGYPYIASADIVKVLYDQPDYTVFLTEARTGSIFAFNFVVSSNKQEAVYLHRKMIRLNRQIPDSVMRPAPLKVLNIETLDWTVRTKNYTR